MFSYRLRESALWVRSRCFTLLPFGGDVSTKRASSAAAHKRINVIVLYVCTYIYTISYIYHIRFQCDFMRMSHRRHRGRTLSVGGNWVGWGFVNTLPDACRLSQSVDTYIVVLYILCIVYSHVRSNWRPHLAFKLTMRNSVWCVVVSASVFVVQISSARVVELRSAAAAGAVRTRCTYSK